MPLTSRDILDLVAVRRGPALQGRLTQIKRTLAADTRAGKTPPASHAALVEALAQAAVDAGPRTPHRHPGHAAGPRAANPRPLTAAELAWLHALPADPRQVSDGDAVTLARLARQVPNGSVDQRIVDTAWQPVRAHNDQIARDTDLAHARQAIDLPEAELAAALADALADEDDTAALNDRARNLHAREVLADALTARNQAITDDCTAIGRTHDELSLRGQLTGDSQRGLDEAVRRFGDRALAQQ